MSPITRLTPELIQALIAEEKANHPEWGRDEIREAVTQKLKRCRFFSEAVGSGFKGNYGTMGFIDPTTALAIVEVIVFLGKIGLLSWKVYKGDTEIPSDVESWIEMALDMI
jgi:hypothetical protein